MIEIEDKENNIYYKNNPEYFEELLSLINTYPKMYCRKICAEGKHGFCKDMHYLKNWIDEMLPLLKDSIYSYSTKSYWILHGLSDFPKCANINCKQKIGIGKNIKLTRGYQKHCSTRCSTLDCNVQEKSKKTCLERYGVEYAGQAEQTKENIKKTSLKRYGVINPGCSKESLQKIKESNLKRYGCVSSFQRKDVIEKIKETNRMKYGVSSYTQTAEYNKRRKQTSLKHYGVEHPMLNQEVKERLKKTSLERYGVNYPSQTKEIQEKTRKTCLERYGVEYYNQDPDRFRMSRQKYKYLNIFFSSSYELAYYIWLSDNNIPFEYQPKISFMYEYNGKRHFYLPDFKVLDQLVEIKGSHFFKSDGTMCNPYDSSQDGIYEAKHQCMIQHNVKILIQTDMKDIMDYVQRKYGKNYLHSFKVQYQKETQK